MQSSLMPLHHDQGIFNVACSLVNGIASRSHLKFLCEIDATEMDTIRYHARMLGDTVPTYTAFVIKAAAMALRKHPNLNGMIQERPLSTRLIPLNDVTATVAVERKVDGLDMVFAPMMARPDKRSFADLTLQLRRFASAEPSEVPEYAQCCTLVRWARRFPGFVGRLFRVPALSPGLWKKYRGESFVVTPPGKDGGCDQVLPLWPWPLTFSFGSVKMRSFVVDGEVIARQTMRLTITVDRRLANGAPLARFAEYIRTLLEDPLTMQKSQQTVKAAVPSVAVMASGNLQETSCDPDPVSVA